MDGVVRCFFINGDTHLALAGASASSFEAIAKQMKEGETRLRRAAAHARQLKESRRTFQVRNALPAQNARTYQPLLPRNISQNTRGHEHRGRMMRFAARSCGYSF